MRTRISEAFFYIKHITYVSLNGYEKWIEKLIVFKWNRVYPKDFEFDMDLSEWKLVESSEFKGSSHDKITMEVYGR